MIKLKSGCVGFVLLVVSNAHAQEESFRIETGLDTRYVKNANLAASDDLEIDEIQADLSLSASGKLENAWSVFTSDLNFVARHYQEQDSRDEQVLIGDLLYRVGRQEAPFALELEYSSEEVSIDPTLGDIPFNRDSRAISSATVIAASPERKANVFLATAGASQVRLDEFSQNNSDRLFATLRYSRRVSPVFAAGIEVSVQQIDYEAGELDSDLYTAKFHAASNLRRASWTAQLGYDRIETGEDEFESPHVLLRFAATPGVQTFNVEARQWMADTSAGDGNSFRFDDVLGQDGRLGVVDQYINKNLALDWSTPAWCRGCRISTGVSYHEEEYNLFNVFDTSEINARVGLEYQAGPSWSVYSRLALADVDYTNDDSRSYEEQRTEIGFRSSYYRNLQLSGMVHLRSREVSDDPNSRSGSYIGLGLTYLLYSR